MKFHFLNFVSRGKPFNAIKGFTYIVYILVMCCAFPVQAQMPVANDIIAFSGGAKSPNNPDVYEINMGDYVPNKEYTITFNRAQGAVANFEAIVPLVLLNNEWFSTDLDKDRSTDKEELRFAASETIKTITITAPDEDLRGSKGYLYLLFGTGNRSKAQYPVLKLVWTNTATPVPTFKDPSYWLSFLPNNVGGVIGNYGVFTLDCSSSADLTVQNDTKLRIFRKSIDHAAQPLTVNDNATAVKQTLLLTPEEAVGDQTTRLTFLYKLSEDAVLTQYQDIFSEDHEELTHPAVLNYEVDSVFGLHYADGSKDTTIYTGGFRTFTEIYADQPNGPMREWMDLPPRFGTITTDKPSYNIDETVTLSIPILNWRLLHKIFGAEWIKNKIDLTLDGGQTFINRDAFLFDEKTGTLTVRVKAANGSAEPITVAAEMSYTRRNFYMDSGQKVWRYPHGAFASYTVTTDIAPFKPITSLDISRPTDSTIFLDLSIDYFDSEDFECVGEEWEKECKPVTKVYLYPVVNTDATFFGGTWTSSDPTIAGVEADGTLIARGHGKVTITFTSDEVAYRADKGLSPNNSLLSRSFDLYVVAPMPNISIKNAQTYVGLSFEEDAVILDNNVKDSPWIIDGEAKMEFIHKDSATYHSIKSVFEPNFSFIEHGWLRLRCPLFFDAKTFPKLPTLVADSTSSPGSDKMTKIASPYILKLSIPFKQTIGNKVITSVFTRSYPVHIRLPRIPQVTLLQEKVPDGIRCVPGDSIVLKYEIKYLSKKIHYNEGFRLEYGMSYKQGDWNSSHNLPFYTISADDLGNLPEGLTITDKGHWYDAELTFKYALPAPNGENKTQGMQSGAELFGYKFRVHEPFYENYWENDYSENREFHPYTSNPDEPEKMVQYSNYRYGTTVDQQMPRQLGEWEDGWQNTKMLELLDEANTTSHNYDAFYAYLDNYSHFRRLSQSKEMDEIWGSADVKLVKTGSNDTVSYTLDSSHDVKMGIPCNKTADYSLIVRYKKYDWERSYTFHADSIGNFYPMTFRLSRFAKQKVDVGVSLPITLYYMRGDSVEIDTTVIVGTRNGEPTYILHEPKGIIGKVRYQQLSGRSISGAADLKTLTGSMLKAHYVGHLGYIVSQRAFNENDCEYFTNYIPVRVVDMQTGQPIASDKNLHVNYCAHYYRDAALDLDRFGIAIADDAVSGTFHIPSFSTEMSVEVIADGYTPTFVPQINKTGITVSLRPQSDTEKYSRLTVDYNDLEKIGMNAVYETSESDFRGNLEMVIPATGITTDLETLKLSNTLGGYMNPLPFVSYGANGALSEGNSYYRRSVNFNIKQFGFENDYLLLSYPTNGFFPSLETVFPRIIESGSGTIVARMPGLRINYINKEAIAWNIQEDVKIKIVNAIANNRNKYNADDFGDKGKLEGGFDGLSGVSFDLPDGTLPLTVETRFEGNRFFIKGIVQHNFVDDLPIVGQINKAGSYMSRLNELETAFESIKNSVNKAMNKKTTESMRQNFTPYVNIYAGLQGYVEAYGEVGSGGSFSWGINEMAVTAQLSAGAAWTQRFWPINFKGKLGASTSFTVGISEPSKENLAKESGIPSNLNWVKRDIWLEQATQVDVHGEVSVGGGIKGLAGAEVGAYAGGGFENRNKLILRPYLRTNDSHFFDAGGYFNVNAYAAVFAEVYFLWWEKRYDYTVFKADKTWYYPNTDENPYKSSTRSLRSSYLRSAVNLPGGIITDVASSAKPTYLIDGSSLLFSNMKDPLNDNDDHLTIYNAGSQSDMLPTSKLPAFGFDAAYSATNALSVVAYEQLADSIRPMSENVSEDSYMQTQMSNTDIYAAVRKGAGSWIATKISDISSEVESEPVDMQPQTAVSANGQTAAVIWRSGDVKVDTTGVNLSGGLYLSRYKNAAWQIPFRVANTNEIGDFVLAISGDSVVIAATRKEHTTSDIENSLISLIAVDKNNKITKYETGMKGRNPQIKAVGDNYYVSFAGEKQLSDTVSVSDIYLMPVSHSGQPLGNLSSGFVGMEDKVSFGFKLVAEPDASSISDLAIVYNSARFESEGVLKNNLVASKLGEQNGVLYASVPTTILSIDADETQKLGSYDVYKSGNTLKAAATVSNSNMGAVIVEGSSTLENKIVCISEEYNSSDLKADKELNIDFYVQNIGMQPLSSLKVTIDGKESTTATSLLPSENTAVSGVYTLPVGTTEADSVSYSILGTFVDGTTHIINGKMDLTQYQFSVDLVSINNGKESNMAIVDVVNNSESPLTTQHQVTVGIYEDFLGKTPVRGTDLQVFPASDFYGDNGEGYLINMQKIVAIQIPNVEEATTYYAIAKVRKNVSQKAGMLRATGDGEDVEQNNRTYAPIQLLPADDPITGNPQIVNDDNILIYAVPGNVRIEIKSLAEGETQDLNIYDISGKLIHHSEITKPETSIPLQQGLYLVSVGTKTEKVIVTQNASNR